MKLKINSSLMPDERQPSTAIAPPVESLLVHNQISSSYECSTPTIRRNQRISPEKTICNSSINSKSPPKKPVIPKRQLQLQPKCVLEQKVNFNKDQAKELHSSLSQIDDMLQEKVSSIYESKSLYTNKKDDDIMSIRSSRSSFYNVQFLPENLVYKNRNTSKKKVKKQGTEMNSSLEKIKVYIDKNSQLSPQVKGTLNSFFDHENFTEGAASTSKLSPEEKLSITKFYDEF